MQGGGHIISDIKTHGVMIIITRLTKVVMLVVCGNRFVQRMVNPQVVGLMYPPVIANSQGALPGRGKYTLRDASDRIDPAGAGRGRTFNLVFLPAGPVFIYTFEVECRRHLGSHFGAPWRIPFVRML